MNEQRSAASGWREKIETGVYRWHRRECASARDRRAGRRCGCRLQVAAPGARSGTTRLVALPDGATISQARNERRRLQSEGRPVEQSDAGMGTVHELAVAYFRARSPHLAPSTIRTTEDAYRLRVAPKLATTPVSAITRPLVEAWLGDLLAEGCSADAVCKSLACLRVLLSFAVEAGMLDRNVCFSVTLQTPPADPDAPPAVRRVLTLDELAATLDACETPREEALVRLAAESGLRPGEVRGLRWPDLDLRARRVTIERAVWRSIVKGPKSRSSRRRSAISNACAEALGRLYDEEVLGLGRDGRGYVFIGRGGVSPIEPDTPLAVVQRVQKRAGVVFVDAKGTTRAKATFHGLRHTSATSMLLSDKSLAVVARQLGHASTRVTAATYEHLGLLDDSLLDDALGVFTGTPKPDRHIAGNIARGESEEAEKA